MAETIVVLNTGNTDIDIKDHPADTTTSVAPDETKNIPIAFSANPADIENWSIKLKQNGACEFHQQYLLGGVAPVPGKKTTLLLSVKELTGGNKLEVKAHGRPKKRRSGDENLPADRRGKRKVSVKRNGSGDKIQKAYYLRGSTAITIEK